MDVLTNPRFLRGLDIARRGGVRQLRRSVWAINSASHGGAYLVDLGAEVPGCCKSPYWNTPRRETKPASKKKAGKKRTK